jgi:hypothetical protein
MTPNNIKMVWVCCDDAVDDIVLLPVALSSDLRVVVAVLRRPFKNMRRDRLTRRMGGWFAMRCMGGLGDKGVDDDDDAVVVALDVFSGVDGACC